MITAMNVRRPQPRFMQRTRQRGVILVVALIFLILLTLLAIGASSGSLLQQRMVSATRNAQLALMSGNTALRGAEWQLLSHPGLCAGAGETIDATTGCVNYEEGTSAYALNGSVTQFRTGNNAWLNFGVEYKGPSGSGYVSGLGTANIARNPRYIIEDMGPITEGGPQLESGVTGPRTRLSGESLPLNLYRITARATGGNAGTVRVVESTFDASPTGTGAQPN